jgi:ribosomal protein S7
MIKSIFFFDKAKIVYKKYVLKVNVLFTRKFTNLVMRDGRKILARQLVEKVVLLHTGNTSIF